jgi:hypothetical protein
MSNRFRKSSAAEGGLGEEPRSKPSALERGQMRRRLRQQQRVREALLLDLGALVFELHRQGRREPELLQSKAGELTAVDQEVRALAEALDTNQALFELVAPGIVGTCPSCGTLLTSDARFCSSCGVPTGAALERPADEAPPGLAATGDGATERRPEPRSDDTVVLDAEEVSAVESADRQGAKPAGRPPWLEAEEAEGSAGQAEPERSPPAGGDALSDVQRALRQARRRARDWFGGRGPGAG